MSTSIIWEEVEEGVNIITVWPRELWEFMPVAEVVVDFRPVVTVWRAEEEEVQVRVEREET